MNALKLAELAVRDTGMGNVEDKVQKNRRKTIGTLNDVLNFRTTGLVKKDCANGILTFHKPVGVVGELTPSTTPAATPANHAIMALGAGNSIIISPSPTGHATAVLLKKYIDKKLLN